MDRLDLISLYCRESFWSHPAIRNSRSLTLSRWVWETLDWLAVWITMFFVGEAPKFHFWRSHPAGGGSQLLHVISAICWSRSWCVVAFSCFLLFFADCTYFFKEKDALLLKLWPSTMFSRAEDPYCWFLGCFQRHLYEWQPSHLFLKLSQLEVQVPRNPQFHHFLNWLYDHCSSKLAISWESWAVDSSWPIFLGSSFLAALPLFVWKNAVDSISHLKLASDKLFRKTMDNITMDFLGVGPLSMAISRGHPSSNMSQESEEISVTVALLSGEAQRRTNGRENVADV